VLRGQSRTDDSDGVLVAICDRLDEDRDQDTRRDGQPVIRDRSAWFASSAMIARGSTNTVHASSKVTPCFSRFDVAFRASQVKRTAQV
jgi:hypothetical protein